MDSNTKTHPQAVERPALDSGDLSGAFRCPHCGSTKGTWFDRSFVLDSQGNEVPEESFPDRCLDCGKNVTNDGSAQTITYIPYREVSRLRDQNHKLSHEVARLTRELDEAQRQINMDTVSIREMQDAGMKLEFELEQLRKRLETCWNCGEERPALWKRVIRFFLPNTKDQTRDKPGEHLLL